PSPASPSSPPATSTSKRTRPPSPSATTPPSCPAPSQPSPATTSPTAPTPTPRPVRTHPGSSSATAPHVPWTRTTSWANSAAPASTSAAHATQPYDNSSSTCHQPSPQTPSATPTPPPNATRATLAPSGLPTPQNDELAPTRYVLLPVCPYGPGLWRPALSGATGSHPRALDLTSARLRGDLGDVRPTLGADQHGRCCLVTRDRAVVLAQDADPVRDPGSRDRAPGDDVQHAGAGGAAAAWAVEGDPLRDAGHGGPRSRLVFSTLGGRGTSSGSGGTPVAGCFTTGIPRDTWPRYRRCAVRGPLAT